MRFQTKRYMSFFVVGVYLFLGGVEYTLIFPTIWSYLQDLGASKRDTYLLGLNTSAYCASAAIAGIIGGRLADRYPNHIKLISLMGLCVMAAGSFQYSLGISVWNVIISRFVAGIGTAAGAAVMAEACRTTRPEERTSLLSIFNAARQIGILLGPAFQILLGYLNFFIGSIHISSNSAPGLIMAVLWSLQIVLTIFAYFNLFEEYKNLGELASHVEEGAEEEQQQTDLRHRTASSQGTVVSADSQMWGPDIQACCLEHCMHQHHPHQLLSAIHPPEKRGSYYGSMRDTSSVINPQHRNGRVEADQNEQHEEENSDNITDKRNPNKPSYYDTFMKDTAVALLSMAFAATFTEMSVETVVPPFMFDYFGYGMFETSLVYMAVGVEGLLVYFLIACLSKHVKDYILNLCGWLLMIVAHILYIVMVPSFSPGDMGHFSCYILSCSFMFLGYPIISGSNASLISKTLSEEAQGMGQGLRRLVCYIGLILGPLWGGATVYQPLLLFSVPLGLLLLHLILFADSFRNIQSIEDELQLQLQSSTHCSRNSEEVQPLLGTKMKK